MGSLMAAIGSSVNELREAQALMTPITLLMTVPWLFWYPISRDPNSALCDVVELHSADERVRDAVADDLDRATADVAGLAVDRRRRGGRRRRALVRLAHLQDWPADARPPAEFATLDQVGAASVTTKARKRRRRENHEDTKTTKTRKPRRHEDHEDTKNEDTKTRRTRIHQIR